MNSLKSLLLTLFVLSIISGYAKINNPKTEDIKILGNCAICKSAIVTAGKTKNLSSISWDEKSKIATITYDSLNTSISGILKRLALAGYDNEMFMAPDDTYAQLPECCQYVRTKKEVVLVEMIEMEMPQTSIETVKTDFLKLVFDNYFEVKNALVQSDRDLTSLKAVELAKSLENVNMNELEMDVHMVWMKVMGELKSAADKMVESKDLISQRTNFISLSNNLYSLIKVAKYQAPVYYQFCPMANDGKGANWLSTESTIKNPYYGSQMLNCGKTVEIIK
jgi:hypothetical protein